MSSGTPEKMDVAVPVRAAVAVGMYFDSGPDQVAIWVENGFTDKTKLLGELVLISAFTLRQMVNLGAGVSGSPAHDVLKQMPLPPPTGSIVKLTEPLPKKPKRRFEMTTDFSFENAPVCITQLGVKGFGFFGRDVNTYATVSPRYLLHFLSERWQRDEEDYLPMQNLLLSQLVDAFYNPRLGVIEQNYMAAEIALKVYGHRMGVL